MPPAASLSLISRNNARVLPRQFYDRQPADVARDLLGKLLFCQTAPGVVAGRIVETEAYLPEGDSACHAHCGRTKRNASMFGPPGHAYVYAIHARWCLNTVTAGDGVGCAVLLRALEPLLGIELMQKRRNTERPRDLCRGPARLVPGARNRQVPRWSRSDRRPALVDRR